MKLRLLAFLSVIFVWTFADSAVAGPPVPITDLFNTGVDATRVSVPDDSTEIHYTYAVPPPTGTVPIVATSAAGFPIPPWLGDSAISAWITPSLDTNGAPGDYTYRTTFTLPSGIDLSQAFIQARISSDNPTTAVLLNGVNTGMTYGGDFAVFSQIFRITRGFVAGVNTLDFVVNNGAPTGPTGLRTELNGGFGPVGHVAIPGLTNTGVTAFEGSTLADNSPDPHYTLSGAITGAPIVATAAGGFPIPPWVGDSPSAGWITPAADTNGPDGDYFYEMTFNMSGLDVASAAIFGQWAVDNTGIDILLNNVSTGNFNPNGFGAFTDFSISTAEGDVFLPGLNTLRFVVNNGAPPGPTGLRVEFLSATAIPEPSTALLALVGACPLLRRRRAA